MQAGSVKKQGGCVIYCVFCGCGANSCCRAALGTSPANEAKPGQITSVQFSTALPDALKDTDYSRTASFDLLRHNKALPSAKHQLFLRTLVLAFGANATAAGTPSQPPPIGV